LDLEIKAELLKKILSMPGKSLIAKMFIEKGYMKKEV
jgi:hypothetical protein